MASDLTGGGMYLVIPYAVAHDMRLSGRAKLLYGEIVRLASARGYCYASNEALLEVLTHEDPDTGAVGTITERTLRRLLAELKDRGHIHTDSGPVPNSGGGETTMRRIFVGQRLADQPQDLGGTKMSPPDKNVREGGTKMSPHIRSKKNIKGSNPPTPHEVWDAVEAYLGGRDGDPEYWDAIEALLRNRQAMGKPVRTRQAMNQILNRLRRVNQRETEIAMLGKAVELNWLTVYPLKPDELPETAKPTSKRFLGTKIVDGVEVDVYG